MSESDDSSLSSSSNSDGSGSSSSSVSSGTSSSEYESGSEFSATSESSTSEDSLIDSDDDSLFQGFNNQAEKTKKTKKKTKSKPQVKSKQVTNQNSNAKTVAKPRKKSRTPLTDKTNFDSSSEEEAVDLKREEDRRKKKKQEARRRKRWLEEKQTKQNKQEEKAKRLKVAPSLDPPRESRNQAKLIKPKSTWKALPPDVLQVMTSAVRGVCHVIPTFKDAELLSGGSKDKLIRALDACSNRIVAELEEIAVPMPKLSGCNHYAQLSQKIRRAMENNMIDEALVAKIEADIESTKNRNGDLDVKANELLQEEAKLQSLVKNGSESRHELLAVPSSTIVPLHLIPEEMSPLFSKPLKEIRTANKLYMKMLEQIRLS
uniref:Uncharacterized protein n=1 Tax=Mucochytrium quahogii TaxID=96639 RepID=A0A7S2RMB6_9STRA|mmetsp:Transcript_28970/g.46729  ORF Transcript_28970/g.46729 Transcript_28970/m.46729 type:complete len:374 (+) Transcript_28970:57-1178(+)